MVRVTVLVLDSAVLPHPLTAALPGCWLQQHTRTTACKSPPANLRTEYIRDYPWRAAGGAATVAAEPECISAQLRSRSPSRSTYIEWVDGWLVGRVLLASAQIK